uniref:Uncharacterized protein n=1 Tax=Moschus moschiferus TaxID=68415 RepID=A0A8C6D8M0_MOSMO
LMVRMWRKGNPPACIIGFNINWYSHYWRTIWRFLKKLEIELPYDPPIPLLVFLPGESQGQRSLAGYG